MERPGVLKEILYRVTMVRLFLPSWPRQVVVQEMFWASYGPSKGLSRLFTWINLPSGFTTDEID
jgi:hypothetical protein